MLVHPSLDLVRNRYFYIHVLHRQIPTIGKKTADKLLDQFGEKLIKGMLADNIYQFVNLIVATDQLKPIRILTLPIM
jgi:Holliday junction resolvasome RuvABC DNA-binding subunit